MKKYKAKGIKHSRNHVDAKIAVHKYHKAKKLHSPAGMTLKSRHFA